MHIVVTVPSDTSTTGALEIARKTFRCTIGRAGVIDSSLKKEGDGKTPLGTYPLRKLLYRRDRVERPETGLPVEPLTVDMGWCEDPAHADYNKMIRHPHPAATDRLMREDHLYDYIVVIGHNDAPIIPGRGSAIFLHLVKDDFSPTAGCVAVTAEDMRAILSFLNAESTISIKLQEKRTADEHKYG